MTKQKRAKHAPSTWLAGLLAVVVTACTPAPEPAVAPVGTTAPPLRSGGVAHLAAVPARDLDALLATVTAGDRLILVFPDGEKLDSRQQFVDFHKQWFADDSRAMRTEIVELIETPALGHAKVRYRYDARNPDGSPRSDTSWLALTSALERGTWRLVFDQNTRIASDAPAQQEQEKA